MKLTVTHKGHTHGGKRLAVGDTFDGSEALLSAFGDRLAMANSGPASGGLKVQPDHDATEEALRAEYRDLSGEDADGRWGVSRLKEKIAELKGK